LIFSKSEYISLGGVPPLDICAIANPVKNGLLTNANNKKIIAEFFIAFI